MKRLAKKHNSRTVALNEKALSTMKNFGRQLQEVCKDAELYENLLRSIAADLSSQIDEGLIDINELQLDEAIRIVGQLEERIHGARSPSAKPRTVATLQSLIDNLCDYSMTDGLTGLRNRSYFLDTLSREMKRVRRTKEPCSIAIIDIDHFKGVNDTYGHHAGDFVLRELARRMLESIRETDTLTRYGGEEFGLILPDANPGQARNMAERIRSNIGAEAYCFQDASVHVTASFGITTYTFDDDADENNLIERADISLYSAKAEGRNRVVCFTGRSRKSMTNVSSCEKDLLVSQ